MKRASPLLSVSLLLLALCAGPTLSPAQPLSPPPGGGGGGGGGTPHWQLTITRSGSTTVTVKDADDNIVTPPSGTYNWNDPEPLPSMEVGYTVTINSAGTYTVTAVWLDASGNPAIPPPDQRLLHLRLTPHAGWSVTVNYDVRNQYSVLSHSANDGWADEEIVTDNNIPGGTAVKNGASDGRRLITLDGSSGTATYTCPQQQAGISVHSTGASGLVSAGCSLTAEAWAWAADLKSVTYSGNHQYSITEDDGLHTYAAPEWQDNSSPLNGNASDPAGAINGDGTINTSGDQRYPVCVRRTLTTDSSTLRLSAAIQFSPGLPAGTQQSQCKIKGWALDTDGHTRLFTVGIPQGNQATIVGNQLQITNVQCMSGSNNYAFPSSVAFLNPLRINWQFTIDGGATWYGVASSDIRVYVIGGENPTTPPSPLYETALDIACRNTAGKTTDEDIVNGVFSAFVGPDPGVKRKPMDGHNAPDATEMKYWPQGYYTDPIFDAPTLIKLAKGRCGAWADFFVNTLAVHSIASQSWGVTPRADLPYPPPTDPTWTGAGTGFSVNPSLPGQGNSGPPRAVPVIGENSGLPYNFSDHAVVRVTTTAVPLGTTIYDPSYGYKASATDLSTAERTWQDHSLKGIFSWYEDASGNPHAVEVSPDASWPSLWTVWPTP